MRLISNVGELLFFRQQFARALHFDSLALALAYRLRDPTAKSHYLASMGSYYLHLKHLPEAKRFLTQALTISRREGAVRNQASELELLALYYIVTDQPARTDAMAREALQSAWASGFLERVLHAYSMLAAEAAERHNYRQAYEWNQRFVALNDTLNSRQTMKALAATQASYENQERLRHICELTQQHETQILRSRLLVGVVALLTIGLLVSGYLYRKLRRSRAALASNHVALEEASVQLRGIAVFKDKLCAVVAHDLRGPVMAFAGVTDLINYFKFTPAGGHVHLEAAPASADSRTVLLSCTDTGVGMNAATVARLMRGPDLPSPTPRGRRRTRAGAMSRFHTQARRHTRHPKSAGRGHCCYGKPTGYLNCLLVKQVIPRRETLTPAFLRARYAPPTSTYARRARFPLPQRHCQAGAFL
jgi:tetratricopeptide (TPR) repeat protein